MDVDARTRHQERPLLSSDRQDDLGRSGLLEDDGPTEPFDRIARLARRLLGVETALVSLVDAHHQVVRGQDGGRRDHRGGSSRPLDRSYCAYVVAGGTTLVVDDARRSPMLRLCPAVEEEHAVAYVGVPLRLGERGDEVGALCVVEPRARPWTRDEVDTLVELGELASTELERRARQLAAERVEDLARRLADPAARSTVSLGADLSRAAAELRGWAPEDPETVDVGERVRLAVALVRSGARPGDLRAWVPDHRVPVHGVRRDVDRALVRALVTATHHAEIGSPVQVSLSVADDRAVVRTTCPGAAVPVGELLQVVTGFGPGADSSEVEIAVTSARTRVRGPVAEAEATPHGTTVVARLPLPPGAEVGTELGVRIVAQRRPPEAGS